MSAPTPSERAPHPERVVGIFIAITWAAAVFSAWGGLAVLLDRDPIERQTSPYVGLVSLLVAALVVYAGVVLTVPRARAAAGSVVTAVGVYAAFVVVAACVDLDLAIAQAVSPFVAIAAVLALVPPWAAWGWFTARRA